MDWGLFAFCGLIWGASFYFIAVAVDHFAAPLVAALRLAFGAAALAGIPAARRPIPRSDWPRVWLLGAVWLGLPFVLFPVAERSVPSSVAGIVNSAVPIAAAAIAALLLRRLPGLAQVAGLAVGFAGVIVIALESTAGSRAEALGIVLLVVAVLCYGLAINLAVPLQQRHGGLALMLRVQLAALALVGPFGLGSLYWSSFAWGSLGATLALGVFGTGLALAAMTTLVGRVGATRGSVVTYLFPVVAIVLGVTLRDERLTGAAVAGATLLLLGGYLVSRRESR